MKIVAEWLESAIYEIERAGHWNKKQAGKEFSQIISLCLGKRPYELGDFQKIAAYFAGIFPMDVENHSTAFALESHIASAAMKIKAMPEDPKERVWVVKLFDAIFGTTKEKQQKFEKGMKIRLESFAFLCRQLGICEPKIEAGELTDFLQEVLSQLPSQPVD